MKTKITFILLLVFLFCNSQTKVIAHKSHSGSRATFFKSYQKTASGQSSFGLPSMVNIVILDTIIMINKSVTLVKMRRSIVCHRVDKSIKDLKKSDFETKIDTFVNHKYFNRKNKVGFVKNYLNQKSNIQFANSVESIVFIGFKK